MMILTVRGASDGGVDEGLSEVLTYRMGNTQKSIFLSSILSILLSGCAGAGYDSSVQWKNGYSYDDFLETSFANWIDASKNLLVQEWGVPTKKEKLSGSTEVYEYIVQGESTQNNDASLSMLSLLTSGFVDETTTTTTHRICRRIFTLRNDKVTRVKGLGDYCTERGRWVATADWGGNTNIKKGDEWVGYSCKECWIINPQNPPELPVSW